MKTFWHPPAWRRVAIVMNVCLLTFTVFNSPGALAAEDITKEKGSYRTQNKIVYSDDSCAEDSGSGGSGSSDSPGDSVPADGDGWTFPAQPGSPITSHYAEDRGYKHRGVDLGAPMGSPIYASRDGVVTAAGPASGFGHWIVIQHEENGQRVDSVYGHMYGSDIMVKPGDTVKAGQQIARIGSDGQSSGAHLHYEEWDGGRDGGTERKPVAVYGGAASDNRGNADRQAADKGTPQPKNTSTTCCADEGQQTSSGPLTGSDNAQKVWNYLKAQGLSDEQVAGVMGNLAHESGDPTFNKATESIEAGSGAGFGLMQWTGVRRGQIEKAARDQGKSLTDLQFQLDYMVEESKGRKALNGGNEWEELKKQSSLEEATKYWMDNAERPGIPHYDRREKLAREYLARYGGSGGGELASSATDCSAQSSGDSEKKV